MTAAPSPTSGIPVFAIGGPTCTGKTELALAVARAVDGELVGADSMQVYRGMDIGTATPRPEELGGVVHHMLSVVAPDQPYDAAAFARDADRAIVDIAARGKRVIVVGGTGLYLRVLLRGLQGAPGPEPGIRAEIMDRAGRDGWPALHAELGKLDPATARRLHPNDGVRILRALEVVRQSGVPMSEWQARHGFAKARFRFALIGVDRDRQELNGRIDARVDGMLAAGFLDEVRALLEAGYGPTLKPMQGLGYKRLCEHLAGEVTLEEARDKIQADTRRLAKRQRTWFRGEPDLLWLPPDPGEIIGAARVFFAEH